MTIQDKAVKGKSYYELANQERKDEIISCIADNEMLFQGYKRLLDKENSLSDAFKEMFYAAVYDCVTEDRLTKEIEADIFNTLLKHHVKLEYDADLPEKVYKNSAYEASKHLVKRYFKNDSHN